jgi:hypothetical protein
LKTKFRVNFADATLSSPNPGPQEKRMSQAFDLSSVGVQDKTATAGNSDFTVVFVACALGLALSLACLVLPGWVFQPTDAISFPLT